MTDAVGDGAPQETFGSWLRKQKDKGAVVVSDSGVRIDGSPPSYITMQGARTTVDLPRLSSAEPLTAEMIRHFNQSLWLDDNA